MTPMECGRFLENDIEIDNAYSVAATAGETTVIFLSPFNIFIHAQYVYSLQRQYLLCPSS